MGPDAERMLQAALALPSAERAELADRLIRSVPEVDGDDLGADERARLHDALAESEDDFAAGHYREAIQVVAELRQRRQ